MKEELPTDAITAIILAAIFVFGFPALRRAWQHGEADGKKLLEELEGRSVSEQIGTYWRYILWPIVTLVVYFARTWFEES